MGKFIMTDGGERSALSTNIYVAERVYEGVKTGYTGTSKNYMLKDNSLCLNGTLPTAGDIQVFESGGNIIAGKIGGTDKTLYLGHPFVYDLEHSGEGGVTSAKIQKNGVTLADDVSGFGITRKFTVANVGVDLIRELMFVSKTTNGVRNVSAIPSSDVYNRYFLVSDVSRAANGDYIVNQMRSCRITVGIPTGGGGEEHQKVEVTITPMLDSWANPGYNYMGDTRLTDANIT